MTISSFEKKNNFSCLCLKHRMWLLVRTTSFRQFQQVATFYVLEQSNRNNVYTGVNPKA